MEAPDKSLAARIDHTVLTPTATADDVRRVCAEARRCRFACVVVHPYYASLIVRELGGCGVCAASVVAFPFGAHTAAEKVHEATALIAAGVDEIDMVMNIGAFIGGESDAVRREIGDVAATCKGKAVLKVIIETAYLDDTQIARVSRLVVDAGADFVKTSTGYAPRGVTVEDVRAIRTAIGDRARIKAAGGIRTRESALALVEAGADRIGCSRSLELLAAGG